MKHLTPLLLLSIAIGCDRQPEANAPALPVAAEASFDAQIAAVREGRENTILVEQTPLTDDDLARLDGLDNLTTLCIDHPDSRVTPAGIAHLARLSKLEHLRIRGPGIGDEALESVRQLTRLKILNLPRGEFTDAGFARLQELPKLDLLRFGSPNVTDVGIESLLTFPSLQRLHLIDVPITDAGLAELAEIEALQSLYIDGGNISDGAWDELFRRRPKLHVHINQQHHDRDPNKHAH
jgi:hypothetical protein